MGPWYIMPLVHNISNCKVSVIKSLTTKWISVSGHQHFWCWGRNMPWKLSNYGWLCPGSLCCQDISSRRTDLCRFTVGKRFSDVIMGSMVSQITSLTIVYSIVYSGADKKHQSSASMAFVWGIHQWPVNSPHKRPVTRKMVPFDDVIIKYIKCKCVLSLWKLQHVKGQLKLWPINGTNELIRPRQMFGNDR